MQSSVLLIVSGLDLVSCHFLLSVGLGGWFDPDSAYRDEFVVAIL